MKTLLLASALASSAMAAVRPAHLRALAAVETGGIDGAVGRSGERTRYQITPRVWQEVTGLPMRASSSSLATKVATRILQTRVSSFQGIHRRSPSDAELYLLWHRPARVLRPRPVERQRAQRFANLVQLQP